MLLFCIDNARLGHFLIPKVVYKHHILFFWCVCESKNRNFLAFIHLFYFFGIGIPRKKWCDAYFVGTGCDLSVHDLGGNHEFISIWDYF